MDLLFRQEAYDAHRQHAHGETFILQPVATRVLTLGGLGITILFLLFITFGHYTNKAKVTGFLEPVNGLLPIWSPHTGIIREIYVKDGQEVKKGEPMFVIATQQTSLTSSDTSLALLRNLHRQKNQLLESLATEKSLEEADIDRLQSAHKENLGQLQQAENELLITQKKVVSQQDIVDSYNKLYRKGFASELEAKQAQHQMLDYQSQEQTIKNRILDLKNALLRKNNDIEKRKISGEKSKQEIQQKILALERSIAEQDQRNASVVLAPDDGVISSLHVYLNQMAVDAQRLATLVPKNSVLKATLVVPSKASGFVQPNQIVTIRYPAFPYQKFGIEHGTVYDVDMSLTMPGEQSLPTPIKEPVYLVSVELGSQSIIAYGKHHPLKAGMSLEADIELETRSIIEWLFEPIIGFSKKA